MTANNAAWSNMKLLVVYLTVFLVAFVESEPAEDWEKEQELVQVERLSRVAVVGVAELVANRPLFTLLSAPGARVSTLKQVLRQILVKKKGFFRCFTWNLTQLRARKTILYFSSRMGELTGM